MTFFHVTLSARDRGQPLKKIIETSLCRDVESLALHLRSIGPFAVATVWKSIGDSKTQKKWVSREEIIGCAHIAVVARIEDPRGPCPVIEGGGHE